MMHMSLCLVPPRVQAQARKKNTPRLPKSIWEDAKKESEQHKQVSSGGGGGGNTASVSTLEAAKAVAAVVQALP